MTENRTITFENQPFRVVRIVPGSGSDEDPMALADMVHIDYKLLVSCELLGPDEPYVRPADWQALVVQYHLQGVPVDFMAKMDEPFDGVDGLLVMEQMKVAVLNFLGIPETAEALEEFVNSSAWSEWIAAHPAPTLRDAFAIAFAKGELDGGGPEGSRGR
jgi:hypothetical protein